MLRRLDDFVRLAREARKAQPDDPLPLLKEKLAAFVLAEARAHGLGLQDEEIIALWAMDIDLNAQGLLVWANG
jgi:hypothetical protein